MNVTRHQYEDAVSVLTISGLFIASLFVIMLFVLLLLFYPYIIVSILVVTILAVLTRNLLYVIVEIVIYNYKIQLEKKRKSKYNEEE